MLNTLNAKKTEKGFTLIELMIVVAIIGILAAIAIPQFSAYRIRAFNAAAVSDVHTARLAEEAVYSDYQVYGGSTTTGVAGTAAGLLLTSTSTSPVVATTTAGQEAAIAISKNVKLAALMKATFDYATITAKHTSGDKFYATESDQAGTYFKSGTAGTAMVLGDAVAATSAADATTASYTAM